MKFRLNFILLLSILLFFSCNTPGKVATSKSPTQKSEEKQSKHDDVIPTKKDTIAVNDRGVPDPKKVEEPKKEEGKKRQKRDVINVVIALPMDGSYDVARFADFVNGMTVSSKDINSGQGKLKLNVINIGNKNSEQELLSNAGIAGADIIVGGFQTSQVKSLAKIASDKNVPYISPWNTSEGIITDNTYYVQLKPALATYCEKMAEFVSTEIRPQIVYIIVESQTSKENVTVERFTKVYDNKHISYKVIQADQGGEWKNTLANYNNIVVNIPNWENKSFVTNTLQQLNALKKNKSIIATGMPQWTEWDQLDFNLFESLSLHIPSFNYVDQESMNAGIFNQNYFNSYNNWPTAESYYGSDILTIIRKVAGNIMDGKRYDPIDQISGNFFSHYRLSNYKMPDPELGTGGSYFHNTYITIQKFEGGRFVPVQ